MLLRFLVTGRKNWVGNRTDNGARAQTVLTSLRATAKGRIVRNTLALLLFRLRF